MSDKSSAITPSDAKQKIATLDNPSTPLETQKLNVELLLTLSVKSTDFAGVVKENNGILVLSTLFKNTNDFDLKVKITILLLYLSLNTQKKYLNFEFDE